VLYDKYEGNIAYVRNNFSWRPIFGDSAWKNDGLTGLLIIVRSFSTMIGLESGEKAGFSFSVSRILHRFSLTVAIELIARDDK